MIVDAGALQGYEVRPDIAFLEHPYLGAALTRYGLHGL
jgi:hypothetical protein